MRYDDLPERWKTRLRDYLQARGSKCPTPGAGDFPDGGVRITFEDRSTVRFRFAFAIDAPEWREVAVFTEHCGYHLFPLYDGLELTTESS
ncbi:hypothetical protein LJ737_00145 [Hymenobacter sp. 15J16-1T3B]|uniref:hypothetical protein n=1 Tax=Hymenobacter sp. 15J16-1T3B TaxID=2886941 RepID=UPI001D0F9176|nr:hypothetical protein [Hymenobacter sp. 15J16-1T3B]MCC3155626.1 hypothetical protein [Hymenobacter sp. 15J16-1T3B]